MRTDKSVETQKCGNMQLLRRCRTCATNLLLCLLKLPVWVYYEIFFFFIYFYILEINFFLHVTDTCRRWWPPDVKETSQWATSNLTQTISISLKCVPAWSLQLSRWERKFSLAGDLADFSHSLGRRVQPQEIARIISQFVNFLQELIFSSNFYIGWDASLKIHRNMFIKPFSIFPNITYF